MSRQRSAGWPAVTRVGLPFPSRRGHRNVMARSAVHPGEILADELQELSVTPTELARQLRVPANRIIQIVQGKRSITGDTASRLGHWFGTSAKLWLNLQTSYDVRIAAQARGAEIARLPTRRAAAGAMRTRRAAAR